MKIENYSKQWFRIENRPSLPSQVFIYGDIGDMGLNSADFINDMRNTSGDLEIHINTQGGVVSDGIAIHNALKRHSGRKTVVVDAVAASIGSVIAMAGDEILMSPGSQMMIHEGQGIAGGDADEMRKFADLLDMNSNIIAGFYAEKTGQPADYWRGQMKKETWYNAQQAIKAGLANGMAKPTGITNSASPEDIGDGWYKDPDGSYRFDPDGDGDDDSSADTDTDNGWWSSDGRLLKAIPPTPSARSHTDVVNWDGPEAMSDAAKSDDPAKAYASICAGRRSGDPGKQSSWALPHHEHPGSPPDEAGVRNALARLPQTQGLVNKSAAQSHLEAHMKEINPDRESSNHLAQQISDILNGIKI
jgi:ATP-dependent protease ClpP protease subunit